MEATTGPFGSSAGVPRSSWSFCQGAVWVGSRAETDLFAVQWDTEEDDAAQAFLDEGPEKLLQSVHSPPALARKGRDLDMGVRLVGDEDGVHEHVLGEGALRLP